MLDIIDRILLRVAAENENAKKVRAKKPKLSDRLSQAEEELRKKEEQLKNLQTLVDKLKHVSKERLEGSDLAARSMNKVLSRWLENQEDKFVKQMKVWVDAEARLGDAPERDIYIKERFESPLEGSIEFAFKDKGATDLHGVISLKLTNQGKVSIAVRGGRFGADKVVYVNDFGDLSSAKKAISNSSFNTSIARELGNAYKEHLRFI
jgi:hypothetical protein